MINAAVAAKTICFVVFIPSTEIIGDAIGCSNSLSGAISAPKNGSTAPMLATSVSEASIITKVSAANCLRRRCVMCCQIRITNLGFNGCLLDIILYDSINLADSFQFFLFIFSSMDVFMEFFH